jgi:hypothetical protein
VTQLRHQGVDALEVEQGPLGGGIGFQRVLLRTCGTGCGVGSRTGRSTGRCTAC